MTCIEPGYIHFLDESYTLDDSEIRNLVRRCLTQINNGIIWTMGRPKNGKTNFLYGQSYDDCNMSDSNVNGGIFEKVVHCLFSEIRSPKYGIDLPSYCYSIVKVSFLLFHKDEYTNSEIIFDALQGLDNPLEQMLKKENDSTGVLNVLQVEVREPVHALNMLKVARKIQHEINSISYNGEEYIPNIRFHSLLVLELESIIFKSSLTKDLESYNNFIYILDLIGDPSWINIEIGLNEEKSELQTMSFIGKILAYLQNSKNYPVCLTKTLAYCMLNKKCICIGYVTGNNNDQIIFKDTNSKEYEDIWYEDRNDYSISQPSIFGLLDELESYIQIIRCKYDLNDKENILKILSEKSEEDELCTLFVNITTIIYRITGKFVSYSNILLNINDIITLLNSNIEESDYLENHLSNTINSLTTSIINEIITLWMTDERIKEDNVAKLTEGSIEVQKSSDNLENLSSIMEELLSMSYSPFEEFSEKDVDSLNDLSCSESPFNELCSGNDFNYKLDDNTPSLTNEDQSKIISSFKNSSLESNVSEMNFELNHEKLKDNVENKALLNQKIGSRKSKDNTNFSLKRQHKFNQVYTRNRKEGIYEKKNKKKNIYLDSSSEIWLAVNRARRRVREYRLREQLMHSQELLEIPESQVKKDNKTLSLLTKEISQVTNKNSDPFKIWCSKFLDFPLNKVDILNLQKEDRQIQLSSSPPRIESFTVKVIQDKQLDNNENSTNKLNLTTSLKDAEIQVSALDIMRINHSINKDEIEIRSYADQIPGYSEEEKITEVISDLDQWNKDQVKGTIEKKDIQSPIVQLSLNQVKNYKILDDKNIKKVDTESKSQVPTYRKIFTQKPTSGTYYLVNNYVASNSNNKFAFLPNETSLKSPLQPIVYYPRFWHNPQLNQIQSRMALIPQYQNYYNLNQKYIWG
ncbi:uncharacterized protein CMU_013650 [Cryptosporidium muris RN66]|uniref:Kinesin motor domain-containing protein n=1 Tax=Cryptosporidium muris (strain RN66) TaxID=441375 RepID=B6AES3_CRYMR|nr:uncharacterized protein CMU_013650 [Cryptosporidium muris RN66]EEA06690.1 hypothetical protein CMU_013650 [Cryptosporidium muris RN66]|eukprot:XP_002141039.1 hypothetical protein [Cryptosporidium muris RN66]